MKLTINIQEAKAAFILELLNNFDFVSIESRQNIEDSDWADELTDEERKMIEKGIADADAGRLIPHKKVRAKIDKWINEKRK